MNHKEPITVHGTSIFKEKANYERRRTKDGVMLSSHLVDEVDTMMSPQQTKTRKRKSRGTTTLPTIIKNKSNGVKLVLEYDAKGEVTGAHRDNYRSYLGVLARTMVPITYKDWFKVPRHLKDKLWTCLEGVFVVDPRSRKKAISDVSAKWRTFKKNLTNYIYDFMSYPEIISKPPEEYDDVVEQETWDLFLKERLSEEFKELRKKQQIRRSFNIYNHKLVRSGYFGLAQKLKTKPDEEFDRSYLWKMARRNKNGEYDNEEIIKLVSKIDEVSKHVEEGKISIEGSDDILTKALGKPEHSGRVRGVGGSVTPSVYFHTPRHVSHSKCEDEVKRLEAQIQQMRNQIDALVQDAARTPQSDHDSNVSRTDFIGHPQNDHIEMETFVSATKKLDHAEIDQMILAAKKDMGRNNCQAKINPPGGNDVQPPISTPTKKKSELCKLAVGSPNNIVAHGPVYERVGPDEKIHTIPLGESNVRVSVDRAIVKDALLPFPIPGEDNTIGGAIGFQLAWPKNLVLIGSDQAISNKAEWLNNVKSIDSFANKNTVERNDVHPTKKITVKGNDVHFAKINTVGRNDVQAKKINLPGGNDVRPPSSTLERKQSGRCKLAVGSPDNIVAHGMMYETVGPDEKIHTIPLGEKNVRVSVDRAIVKEAILPFPIPGEDNTVGGAVGFQLAWPKELALIGSDQGDPINRRVTHNEASPKKVEFVNNVESINSFASYVNHLSYTEAISIALDKQIFGKDLSIPLYKEDMENICEFKELAATCIILYMSQLYNICKAANKQKKFVFVSPYAFSGTTKIVGESKATLLAIRLSEVETEQLVLVPCNLGARWILVVIDLSSLMVYYLDSVDVKVNPSLQIVINTALKIYETTKGNRRRNSTWRVLKCPKQPLAVVSGFYVMRYMKDLLSDQDVLTNEDFNGKKTYTDAEFDEVRAEWISFVLSMV